MLTSEFRLLVYILLSTLAFSQFHQPCYYDIGKEADSDIIPCYEGGSVSSCCMRGSNCLGDDACWDPETQITYQYGCTDETYQDAACPKKCGLDTSKSNWVGLIYCDGTDHTPNNTWICHHPDTCNDVCPLNVNTWPATLTKLPRATCSDIKPLSTAFTHGSVLDNKMNLPTDLPDVSSYFSAHATRYMMPSASAAQSTSQSISFSEGPPAQTSISDPMPPSNTSIPTSSSSAPSITAMPSSHTSKAAIGASVGVGVTVGLALIALAALWLRRRQRSIAGRASTPANGEKTDWDDSTGFTPKPELDGTPMSSPLGSPIAGYYNEKAGHVAHADGVHEAGGNSIAIGHGPTPQRQRMSEIQSNEIYEMPG